ncbi:MAG: 30S ribosomal protein S17e [Candidatus Diapherotrites archaeon ADurb.Bin253]|jgi:ribosomal protein S17E|nr:30S ribosomal protein S17e [Candidatus Pacearchaeota archaeon]OQA68233.1 MAG: 30S ribosomal protein S17e [Candidatus Diapherotrites archaeon ADurb.Bin253]HNZ52300.1 30S ribosomal protein S17e [Candidatus Pacearchaeota archaeon]HOC96720.1 30S ribosomal protein S17e [Candidatus Pacearchaeota archaeon]HOF44259.1 30S ribosomal protein S17e [Candidatus Pacearchaeota archaeon]
MGKIKSKTVRKTANILIKEDLEFSKDFEKNKRILGKEMPSKRIRNRLAGLISRLKKQEEKAKLEMQ